MLQHPKYLKMNLTLLDVFTQMITSLESPIKKRQMQEKLDALGVTELIVDLISRSDEPTIFDQCVNLGIALLDGMNAKVQEHFYTYWVQTKNVAFFQKFKATIDRAVSHEPPNDNLLIQRLGYSGGNNNTTKMNTRKTHEIKKSHGTNIDPTTTSSNAAGSHSNTTTTIMSGKYYSITQEFRFLQLLCEGHYLHIQRYLIAQSAASASINLVDATTSYLLDMYLNVSGENMLVLKQLFDTIAEFCQVRRTL
jgi:hypothetical protein